MSHLYYSHNRPRRLYYQKYGFRILNVGSKIGMTPEINEFLKRAATAKGITVILLFLTFLAIFVWRNIDLLTEISFTLRKPDQAASPEARREVKEKHTGRSSVSHWSRAASTGTAQPSINCCTSNHKSGLWDYS